MKKIIFNFLNENKLSCPKIVNSLLVNIFLIINNIETKNSFLLEVIDFKFNNKKALAEELSVIISSKNNDFTLELLIKIFEFVISPHDRIINGAIYTPKNIRSFIISSLLNNTKVNLLSSYKFADLSCGCGAFLIDVAKAIKQKNGLSYAHIFQNNIYGVDIEDYAIVRAKILLSLLAITEKEDEDFKFNLLVKNSLTFNWNSYIPDFSGFDIIVGNPPYVTVKHMSLETRQHLSKMETCQVGGADLYIPFFEIGVNNLSPNGKLGFITMNSFFKSLNGRNLRQYFQKKRLDLKIIDFGAEQVFHSKNTYTCICFISNIDSNVVEYTRISPSLLNKKQKLIPVLYSELDSYNGWNLYANQLISKIEKTGTPLGEKYKTSHGLATLKNELYIFRPTSEDECYYTLTTKDGRKYLIEKTICMPVINSNKLSRKSTIDALKEQLIFPYTNEKKPVLIDELFFAEKYPNAYYYLSEYKVSLASRDKGNGNYKAWYAFGRTQGLEQIKHKMFFPKYSDVIPHYLIHSCERTYFYNGQAFFGNSIRDLKILKKILQSKLFWFYISSTSKPYASNYYSLNGTYIKNFGICNLTKEEEDFILKESDRSVLDSFFEKKYNVNF